MTAKKYDDGKAPVFQGFLQYFPNAIKAVAFVSYYGKEKYEVPFSEKNFLGLDPDRLRDADARHVLDEVDDAYDRETSLLHAAQHAWEAMAVLEVMLRAGTPLRDPYVTESLSDLAAKARKRPVKVELPSGEGSRETAYPIHVPGNDPPIPAIPKEKPTYPLGYKEECGCGECAGYRTQMAIWNAAHPNA